MGLDKVDAAILDAIVRRFGGGPVGLSTLAVAVGEEPDTLEDVYEPFLMQTRLHPAHPTGSGGHRGCLRHIGVEPTATERREALLTALRPRGTPQAALGCMEEPPTCGSCSRVERPEQRASEKDGITCKGLESLIFLALLIGIFYFMLIRPQKRRVEQHKQLVESIGVGDEVVTIGGMYATV